MNTVRIPKVRVELPDYDLGKNSDGEEVVYKNGGYAILLTGGTVTVNDVEYLETKAVPFYDMSEPDEDKRMRTFDPLGNNADDVVMIVKNPGELFSKNDTFTVSAKLGNPCEAEVEETDGAGRVKILNITEPGYDFSNAGFTNVTKERLVSNVSTGINLYSGGSQATEEGQGFFAVLVRGEVQPFKTVDSKPEIATSSDSYRLSIKSNKDNDYTGTYFGLEAGVEEVTADILPEKITSDRKYDLFFHFHNDIGHTIMMNDTWYDATRPVGDEQYIDLTITTN